MLIFRSYEDDKIEARMKKRYPNLTDFVSSSKQPTKGKSMEIIDLRPNKLVKFKSLERNATFDCEGVIYTKNNEQLGFDYRDGCLRCIDPDVLVTPVKATLTIERLV